MNHSFNILFLSNMMEEKGVWTLVDACLLLKQHSYRFECHFVGKWSDITEEMFHSYLTQKGLEDMVFAHGAKYGDEKSVFWQHADVFVFPTYYHNECFPLVLLEAMQQGVACIASHEGGIPDIIEEGKTGFIVDKKDAQQLADKIASLIAHPEACERMGKAGKEKFLKEFTLKAFEKNMIDILNKCLG